MSNFFFIKFRKKNLNQDQIKEKFKIFKSIYQKYNIKYLDFISSTNKKFCLFYSSDKNKFFENKNYIYFLNGNPICNSKKLSVNFFVKNERLIFNSQINNPWTFIKIHKNGNVNYLQNILSHKPSYYVQHKDFYHII